MAEMLVGGRRPLADMVEDAAARAAWARLMHEAADPNPFYGPDWLAPLVRHCAPRAEMSCLVVWEGARLVAFLPVVVARTVPLVGPRVAGAFAHPLLPDTTPLLDARDPARAAAALLAAFAEALPGLPLRLPSLVDGPTRDALEGAAGSVAEIRAWLRAAIVAPATPPAGEDPLAAHASAKRRSKLRRAKKALRGEGTLALERLAGADLARGVADFLALETAGWKGVRGTALAARPDTALFAAEALRADADAPRMSVGRLALDGRALATTVHLEAGARSMVVKTAYDEAHAAHSPGMLLLADLARETLRAGTPERLDSCAVPGHPVEAIWADRIGVCDLLLAPSAAIDASSLAATIARQDALIARAKATVKRLIGRRETAGVEERTPS